DAAHPDTASQRADVIAVLDAMVADGTLDESWPRRCIEVLNKADLLGGAEHVAARAGAVAVSAITGEGLPGLMAEIDGRIAAGMIVQSYVIPSGDGARLAWLYRHGEVIARADESDGVHVTVRLLPADQARFEQPAQSVPMP
ncbi:MAG: GTPase HflX, partial [Rhodospirillales bacterium]|nr:GTPase HflX [Rhodospirillales bacterium]